METSYSPTISQENPCLRLTSASRSSHELPWVHVNQLKKLTSFSLLWINSQGSRHPPEIPDWFLSALEDFPVTMPQGIQEFQVSEPNGNPETTGHVQPLQETWALRVAVFVLTLWLFLELDSWEIYGRLEFNVKSELLLNGLKAESPD